MSKCRVCGGTGKLTADRPEDYSDFLELSCPACYGSGLKQNLPPDRGGLVASCFLFLCSGVGFFQSETTGQFIVSVIAALLGFVVLSLSFAVGQED